MIRKLIQSYRRKRLLKAVIEKHGDRVYSYEHGWSSNRIFYDVRGGELIAFNSRKLCEVPVESTWLPALSEMSCFDTIPDDRRYSEFVEAVEFMKATGFPRNAGSPYFNSDRGVLYIHPASLGLDGKWVNLLTQDGASVHFPAAAFNMIYGHQRTDDHDKYLQRAAIWFDQPATPFTPVIEVIRLAEGAKNGAGNLLRTSPICDAIKIHENYDIIIDIARLDASSAPVVDMLVFLRALRNSAMHNSNGYTLDIGRIKLRMGMFPVPIPIDQLKNDHPDHRVILSDLPCQEVDEKYLNQDLLPKGYP